MDIETKFIKWLASCGKSHNAARFVKKPGYWFTISDELCFNDFNREVIEPKDQRFKFDVARNGTKTPTNSKFKRHIYKNGAVTIRMDDDFWLAAILPLRFRDIDCATLVKLIWPDLQDVIIKPDHGDYWWKATSNDELEIPNSPVELWQHWTYRDGKQDIKRSLWFSNREEAEIHTNWPKFSIAKDTSVKLQIREWKNGVREEGPLFDVPESNIIVKETIVGGSMTVPFDQEAFFVIGDSDG